MILEALFTLKMVVIAQASESYYVSDRQRTWKDAVETHTLATPEIHYNEQNMSMNIRFEFDNKEVWIGYFKALTAFEYFGCMREEIVRSANTFKLDSNGPGICFSTCGKQVLVGLRGEMCYCVGNKPTVNHHLPYCDQTCKGDNSFLCGGDDHISLYKVNKKAVMSRHESDLDGYKCLQIDNNEHLLTWLSWRSCRSYFKTMCTFENGTILTNRQSWPWKNATQKCFQINGFATSYANTTFNFDQLPRGTSWTEVIRSNVIYKYNEIDIRSFNKIECGYTDTERVLFTDKCNLKKEALCRYESSSAMSYMATSELTSSDGSTTTEMARSTSLTEAVTALSSNISTANQSGADRNEQEVESKGSDVSVIIGASVAAVLVVFAVVVVIVILKRRQKNQSAHQTKDGYISEQTDYITPISTEAGDRFYSTMTDENTGEVNDGYEIPNPRRNVYESLHDRVKLLHDAARNTPVTPALVTSNSSVRSGIL